MSTRLQALEKLASVAARKLLPLFALVVASACSSAQERAQAELMDSVEQRVTLPKDARRMDEYARFYAKDENGEVIGIYLVPDTEPIGPDVQCEELMPDGSSQIIPCQPSNDPNRNTAAGERRWIDDYQYLPSVLDGGCDVIRIRFDSERQLLTYIACNGHA